MKILAIDPGTTESGWFVLDDDKPVDFGISSNEDMRQAAWANGDGCDVLAVEMVRTYGMAVGEETFRTVWWCGRFVEAWHFGNAGYPTRPVTEIFRSDVKSFLCHSGKATDANIRQAIIDLYGGEGGKDKAIGRKAAPGPLYGVSGHAWAALAMALTARNRFKGLG